MAGTMKDALEKSGTVTPDDAAPEPSKRRPEWKEPLRDDHPPHMPFEAPALTKAKPSSRGPGPLQR
jgi:hypothetical protein